MALPPSAQPDPLSADPLLPPFRRCQCRCLRSTSPIGSAGRVPAVGACCRRYHRSSHRWRCCRCRRWWSVSHRLPSLCSPSPWNRRLRCCHRCCRRSRCRRPRRSQPGSRRRRNRDCDAAVARLSVALAVGVASTAPPAPPSAVLPVLPPPPAPPVAAPWCLSHRYRHRRLPSWLRRHRRWTSRHNMHRRYRPAGTSSRCCPRDSCRSGSWHPNCRCCSGCSQPTSRTRRRRRRPGLRHQCSHWCWPWSHRRLRCYLRHHRFQRRRSRLHWSGSAVVVAV